MSIIQTQCTSFKKELYQGIHDLSTDTIKMALYTGNANLNETTTVYTPVGEVQSINTAVVSAAILDASVSQEPGNTLFKLTTVGGRPLGDINNSGTVTSADSFAYNRWAAGTMTDAAQIAWVEGTLNPYMFANPVTYAAYLVGNGYTAGGNTLTGVAISSSGYTAYANWANTSWTAALTARCALVYNASKANRAIAVIDFGADKTSTTTFLVTMPANTATTALIRSSN